MLQIVQRLGMMAYSAAPMLHSEVSYLAPHCPESPSAAPQVAAKALGLPDDIPLVQHGQ